MDATSQRGLRDILSTHLSFVTLPILRGKMNSVFHSFRMSVSSRWFTFLVGVNMIRVHSEWLDEGACSCRGGISKEVGALHCFASLGRMQGC